MNTTNRTTLSVAEAQEQLDQATRHATEIIHTHGWDSEEARQAYSLIDQASLVLYLARVEDQNQIHPVRETKRDKAIAYTQVHIARLEERERAADLNQMMEEAE